MVGTSLSSFQIICHEYILKMLSEISIYIYILFTLQESHLHGMEVLCMGLYTHSPESNIDHRIQIIKNINFEDAENM